MAINVENDDAVPRATGQILLRPFRLEDATAKDQLDADLDIKRYLGSPSKIEDDIADFNRQGYGLMAIVEVSTDHIIGYAKLQCPDWKEDLGLELIVAVAPKCRRRGFALEAAQMLIVIGCGPLQQKQIVGRVTLTNSDSLSLVYRLGMTKADERKDLFDGVQNIFVKSCGEACRINT